MDSAFNICQLIENGGGFDNIEGSTPEEIYDAVSKIVPLPIGLERTVFRNELVEREKILSTAVGNGIAIPHPRKPLIKNDEDQRIIVCYPKKPLSMGEPDERKVGTMFILLSKSNQVHILALSAIAKLIHDKAFRDLLETRPDIKKLTSAIVNSGV